jgi:type VI secretion system protein ImpJ
MTWTNRVVWQGGMFLSAQQFQQQDRHVDQQIRAAFHAARPHGWGMTEMVIDRDLLRTGRFGLAEARGFFTDGTAFAWPDEADHPAPLDLDEGARSAVIYLAVPTAQPGAAEMTQAANGSGRYAIRDFAACDTHSASPDTAEVLIGRLRLCYLLEGDDRSGYLCIPLARVVDVTAGRRVTLDDRFIPPCITVSASPSLCGLLAKITNVLNQYGDALAAWLGRPAASGISDMADVLLLQSVNRWHRLMVHWADSPHRHPEDLYAALVQMAGEFATFTEPTRRPGTYPPYRHQDLQRSFTPLMADLRRWLSAATEPAAMAIPLQDRRQDVCVVPIADGASLHGSNFVLSVQADMPKERLRRLFPAQAKIGAVEHIHELVNVALPGIAIRPLPAAPRQIPFHAGASYFELDRDSPHWQQMKTSDGFAIHVSGDFPNLRLELWTIRG